MVNNYVIVNQFNTPLDMEQFHHVIDSMVIQFQIVARSTPTWLEVGLEAILNKVGHEGEVYHYRTLHNVSLQIFFVRGSKTIQMTNLPPARGHNYYTNGPVKPKWAPEELWQNDEGTKVIVRVATNCDMMAYRTYGSTDPGAWNIKHGGYLYPFGFTPAYDSPKAEGNG